MAEPTQPSVEELLQLIKSLYGAQVADTASADSSGVARDANANYREWSNKTGAYADTYGNLLDSLAKSINTTPEQDADFARNRADQIFSSYSGSVDRANTIAASQAGATAYKRGMGDSSQATDQVGNLTRNFSDVYSKLQEVARQRAFDELKSKGTQNTANFNVAAQGLNGTLKAALDNAQQYASAAGKTATAANTARGKSFEDVMSTGAVGGITKAINDSGGYQALLKSLKDGLFGSSMPEPNPLAPQNAGSTSANPKPGEFGYQTQDWGYQYDIPTTSAGDAQGWADVQLDESSWNYSEPTSFEQAYDY